MRFNKIIALGVVAATLATPMSTLAATTNSATAATSSISTQQEKDKFQKYVTLDFFSKEYQIADSAKKELSNADYATLKNTIAETNKTIAKLKNDGTVNLIPNGNSLKVVVKPTQVDPIFGESKHLNTYTNYWDYSVEYWGMRIFLSHHFVEDLKTNTGNWAAYTAGASVEAAFRGALGRLGMTGTPLTVTCIALAGMGVLAYDKIVSRCNDCGVFIDINATGVLSSIYGAWDMEY